MIERWGTHVGIDPGLQHTGYAVLFAGSFTVGSICVHKLSPKEEIPEKLCQMLRKAVGNPAIMAIEQASLWGGGTGLSRARGALGNLEIGAIIHGFFLRGWATVVPVKATSWKGGTPKKIFLARVRKKYPTLVLHGQRCGYTDAWDALGILLWLERTHV